MQGPVVNRKPSIPVEFDIDENCDDEQAMLEGRQEDNPAARQFNESDLE